MWLADFAAHAAARNCVGRSSLMIGRLRRMLAVVWTGQPAGTPRAGWPTGRSIGALARTLEEFFVDAGLAFPVDHAAQLSAGRRRRLVEETAEPLRLCPGLRFAGCARRLVNNGPGGRNTSPRRSHDRRRHRDRCVPSPAS